MKNIYDYGTWPSPVTTELLTAQTLRFSEPQAYGTDVFWLESRPAEKGRNALVQLSANGVRKDVLAEPHSVRTRAHEYGGGSYLITDDKIFCVLDADQRIYIIDRRTAKLATLTDEGNFRYADFYWDNNRHRLICVREDYSAVNHKIIPKLDARSGIVSIDLNGNVQILISGADFYSNPRLNPDSNKLSYLCWNHPQMPWDGTECYCAELTADNKVINIQLIAGSKTESIFQPQWSPEGNLFFVSDRNNWWNLYYYNVVTSSTSNVITMPAEFATPQWVFGISTYGFLNSNDIFCCFSQNGQWHLALININQRSLTNIHSDFNDISSINCSNGNAYFLAAGPMQSTALFNYDDEQFFQLTNTGTSELTADDISPPHSICFATSDNEFAHGFYYSPKNKQVCAPENTLPPLIVICHGGPTGATESSLNLKIQFWTSRGFAVLDINYRGSTGYGRHYRDRLKNNWGITDVIDACSGAHYLIEKNVVDAEKIAIRGNSAGGYTVLAALTFTNTFKAGASLYGIGDLEALVRDTHKFEAHYLDNLIGEYPAQKAIYHARSPLYHIEKMNCPVIFFQGLKDQVVPPQQAEAMVNALRKKNIRTEYLTFADEGHGFRQAATIAQAIEAELAFYQSVFNDHKRED